MNVRLWLLAACLLSAFGFFTNAHASFISVVPKNSLPSYPAGSTVEYLVKKMQIPNREGYRIAVEAMFNDGSSTQTFIVDHKKVATYRTPPLVGNSTVIFRAFLENGKRVDELKSAIVKAEKQILEIDRLLESGGDISLVDKKSKLQRSLGGFHAEILKMRESVQEEVFVLQVGEQNSVLNIISPISNSTVSSSNVTVRGLLLINIQDVRIFVDDTQVPNVQVGQEFSLVLNDYLQAGPNELSVRVLSGADLVEERRINLIYVPDGSGGKNIGPEGGNVEINDSTSPLNGFGLLVPSGALSEESFVAISYPNDIGGNIDFNWIPVSVKISLRPLFTELNTNSFLTIPIVASLLPTGTTVQEVKVFGSTYQGWVELPISEYLSSSVVSRVDSFNYHQILAVVPRRIGNGELLVKSNLPGASIYVDGVSNGQFTPNVISGLTDGQHEVKLYIPGYNEIFHSIEFNNSNNNLNSNFETQTPDAPSIILNPEIVDGMYVSSNLFEIKGSVSGASPESGRLVISQNGEDTVFRAKTDGTFAVVILLAPGANRLQVRYTNNEKTRESSFFVVNKSSGTARTVEKKFESDLKSNEIRSKKILNTKEMNSGSSATKSKMVERVNAPIRVVLTWDKDETDVDLHVYDDYGGHAWFGALDGIEGGLLDRDDINGFGPEVFTLPAPKLGKYKVRLIYYQDNRLGPTTAKVSIYVSNKKVYEGSRKISLSDLWDVFTFEVSEFSIGEISTANGPSLDGPSAYCRLMYKDFACDKYRLTTLEGDNLLTVKVNAPANIDSNDISLEVTELSRNTSVEVTQRGRSLTFPVTARPITTLMPINAVKPLIYQIRAKTTDGTFTDPVYVIQDTRSRIRQEYIDKRVFYPDFARPTPSYESITDRYTTSAANFYTFQEMVQFSDFAPLGIVNRSPSYADVINSAWLAKYPDRHVLKLNSGWRNPIRNDWLGPSSKDSWHQTGDAIDFIPNVLDYPGHTADELLLQICRVAVDATTNTDVIYHDGHVHIERSSGGRYIQCNSGGVLLPNKGSL